MNIRLFLLTLQTAVGGIVLVLLATVLWSHAGRNTVSKEGKLMDNDAVNLVGRFPQNVPDSIPSPHRGKELWKNVGCGQCHAANMKDALTGPALGGVTNRWVAYPSEDLYAWIRNSQLLIDKEHPRAVAVWREWSPTVMSSYPDLSDAECADLLAYIEAVYAPI